MNPKFEVLMQQLLQKWEQTVQAHQRWKKNPSAQCAWELIRLTLKLIYYLVKLYIKMQ